MNRYMAPVITGFLVGAAAWIVDAVVFLYLNSSVSVMGAFLVGLPLYRLFLRILILLCTVLLGGIKAYHAYIREFSSLGLNDQVPEEIKNFAKAIHTPRDFKEQEKAEKQKARSEAKKTAREFRHASQADRVFSTEKPLKKHKASRRASIASSKGRNVVVTDFAESIMGEQDIARVLWQYAGRLGETLHLAAEELQAIRGVCYCYNIGRFGVCEGQLSTDSKENALLSHSEVGARIAEAIPALEASAELIRYHHERFDGSGLMAMSGLEIPLGSRIFAVAWVYNALTRPDGSWRLKGDDALETLYQYSGTALDPELVAAFIGMMSGGKYFVDAKAKGMVWNS